MNNPVFNINEVDEHLHHPAMSDLTDILCHRTGNVNRDFFQAEVAYFLGLIPSAMRTMIVSPERGTIPINIYCIALATSGFGKGHSVSLMEEVISDFRDEFTHSVFPDLADTALFELGRDIAARKGGDEDVEKAALEADFRKQGFAPFLFDSGTGPAVKQLRYKLLLAQAGSINFQMDEIGSNLMANNEVLNTLLELYDLGRIKNKLTKNTADNERGMDIVGDTPANVLMFGTTSKLFDGSKTEEEFFSFLETGYARRCFFGIGKPEEFTGTVDPEAVYNGLVSKNQSQAIEIWKQRLRKFADRKYHNIKITVPKEVGVRLIAYRLFSEGLANEMPEHEVIRKAELSHRYFKALKLAGVFAFLDDSPEITMKNLYQALKVTEESGKSFGTLLKRERNFVRLAKYIAETPGDLTHADLVEDLPYYPASTTPRREIMDLAMAWSVNNHIALKRRVTSSVEFFSGSTLQETDLNELFFSYSDHFAYNYRPEKRPFDKLPQLLGTDGLHWANHHFNKEHRSDDDTIEGFNMLVVDVDGDIPLAACQELLSEYTYITATTKSHTEDVNRFRLIMPTNYILYLDKADYRDFMNSFLLWLPFESDMAANQRSKKWMTCEDSEIKLNRGTKIVDILPFIPKTKQNTEYTQGITDLGRLDHLERWFLNNMDVGNRNNNLLNFAMMLGQAGMAYDELESKVLDLNERSPAPLKKDEVQSTVLKSVAQKFSEE